MDTTVQPKKRRRASLEKRRANSGYIFVLPFILGILLIYLPILIDSIWFSFNSFIAGTDENGFAAEVLQFAGFKHYVSVFTSTTTMTKLLASIQQLIFEVPAIIIFSLFIAVVLNQKMLGRAVFRAIYFVPVIIATGLMISINGDDTMTDQMEGGINDGSGTTAGGGIINMLDVQALFSSMAVGTELVAYVVSLVNSIYSIINYSGVQMLIFLAGLQSISPSIYEACRIDGASGWETFWKVTFPMISPMILVNSVYTIIDSFTRTNSPMMRYIDEVRLRGGDSANEATAMYWVYFIFVIAIIGIVAAIASTMVFYQRKD